MHPSSVAFIENKRNELIITASKSLEEQILRGLASNPVRGSSFFLRTPYYEVQTDVRLLKEVSVSYAKKEFTEIFKKTMPTLKPLGFFKGDFYFVNSYEVRIRLYFDRAAIFK